MAKKIITISREFGSGGREIGEAIARELGYTFYDRELIEEIAKVSKLSPEFVAKRLESSPSKSLWSYLLVRRGFDGVSKEDYLFDVQKRLIEELANREACVIVGRCANAILRERKDVLSVFISAREEDKTMRIMERYHLNKSKAQRMREDTDKKRSSNYNYYTDGVWGMASEYDITLNSSSFGYKECVEMIVRLVKDL